MSDNDFMREAIAEARAAQAAGEVPVGAVVVLDGVIIGRGQNRVLRDDDPTAHAEIVAMRSAARTLKNYRLLECRLYVTLEPCAMCAGAITHARIAKLIYGADDPKAGACSGAVSAMNVLNHDAMNHIVNVERGVAEEECGDVLREFFRARR